MSRHILVDRPNCLIVLGFDHMLRSFFGQVFRPNYRRRMGIVVAGWPTAAGLGTRRPPQTYAERDQDLHLLITWARGTQPEGLWEHPEAARHLDRIFTNLRLEWEDGEDEDELRLPALMKGPLT